jgi:hypothetical protein
MRESIAMLLSRVSSMKSATESEKRRIIGFIATRTTMADDELFFIKHLTKSAGKHMVNMNYQPANEFLERLYLFNIQGATKTRKQYGLSLNNIVKMRVHFIGYAADVSMRLYNQTEDGRWLKRWYLFRKYCAEQSIGKEPQYAVYSFISAARAAFAMFTHIRRLSTLDKKYHVSWLQKAYDNSIRSAELLKYSSEKAASCYLYCGHYMTKIFSITLDKKFAEMAVACYQKSVSYPSLDDRIKADVTAKIKSLERLI